MSSTPTRRSALELFDAISHGLVALGLITFILFPFAVPVILLTIFVLAIVAIPALVLGVLGAVLASPVLLMMRLRRTRRDRPPPPAPPGAEPRPEVRPRAFGPDRPRVLTGRS